MKKSHLQISLSILLFLAACVPVKEPGDISICTPGQLSVSSNEMPLDGGLLQGFTFTNTGAQPCALPRIPLPDPTNANAASVVISQTANPDPAAQLILAPQALAILTIRWTSPCNLNGNIAPTVLLLAGQELILSAPAATLPACEPGQTPSLELSNFNFPP